MRFIQHATFGKTRSVIKFIVLTIAFLVFFSSNIRAAYTIGTFNNGTFCTSTFPSSYQSGSFSITETSFNNNNGFTKNQTSKTLILGFSGGNYQFNPGVGTVTVSGAGVTIVSYVIAATSITVTITTASTNTVANVITFNNIEVRAASAAGTGKIVRTGGTFLIDNRTTRPRNTTTWGALSTATPITYSSSTVAQTASSSVFSGSNNNQILNLQVVVTGTCNSLSITQFNFNTTGSTNPVTDISGAKLYYTGTTNAFSTTSLFGSVITPNGAFSITGTVNLATAGTYYFWLTYDVTPLPTSINNDLLDAQFASVVIGGSTKTPSITNPAGTRTISNNIYYSITTGNWNNTAVWSKTSGGTTCGCTPSLGNGWVFVNHAVTLNTSSTVDIVTVQSGGVLTNSAGSVLTTTILLNTLLTGTFTISSNAWVLKDLTLGGSGTSKSSLNQTLTGDLNIGSGTTFQMTAASGTTLTVNGDIGVDGTLSLSGNNMTASNAAGQLLTGTGSITGTGTITLGVSKLITSGTNLSIAPALSISSGATVTNQATINMTNNLSGAGIWLNDVSANLNVGGTTSSISITTLTSTASGNTITYNGSGAQTVKGTTYENLVLAGSNTKTLGATTVVSNTLSIGGSAQLTTGALGLSVDNQWINNSSNATPFSSTGTVTFTGDCTITGSAVNTFNHIAIASTGDLLAHPTAGKIVVAGNWANGGDFDHNDSDITFSGTTTISGTSVTAFNNVIVSSTKSLTLPSGGDVNIEGDITVNGTLTTTNSNIIFSGDGNTQNITGSVASYSFNELEINNLAGTVQLQKPVTVTNALTLTDGNIKTSSTNSLTLNNAVTITGGSKDSFVNGPLIHVSTGNSTVKVFPIGKSSDYRPITLTITATGSPTSNYTAELINASAHALNYSLPVGIDRASGVHYWTIAQSNSTGFTNAKVQLAYDVNDDISDPTHLVVLKNVGAGTTWFNTGGTGTGAPAGTITSTTFTTFGTFTFGNNGANVLPIELVKFEASVNSDHVDLNWTTASELVNDYFTIEKTRDGKKFEEVANIKGAGTSNTALNYTSVDVHPYPGRSYYRLKQTDFNGTHKYSEVVAVTFSGNIDFSVYPNPVTGSSINIRISGNVHDEVLVVIRDMMGNQVYSGAYVLNYENDLLTIDNMDDLTTGVYVITASNSVQSNHQRVVIP